jgi:cation transport protein ChaC
MIRSGTLPIGVKKGFIGIQRFSMTDPVWLFGYGSLIWRPDFPYLDSRRFWQGSHFHRGVETNPGRVVTVVNTPGERCYRRAFLIDPKVIEHLDAREKNCYERNSIDICFDDANIPGVVYIAPNANPAFLGDAPLDEIATQIDRCKGRSGTNVDYLLQLARELRRLSISDSHVFELETLVLAIEK